MATIPRYLRNNWKKGQKAKATGDKEKAMKHFTCCYDALIILNKSYNTGLSETYLEQRTAEVEKEIRTLLSNKEYLQTTIVPEEGIAEIKAFVGMSDDEKVRIEHDSCELIKDTIFVKIPTRKAHEIEKLVLVEYKNKSEPLESVLNIRITCEGKTEEFLYDQGNFGSITISDIALLIRESTGREFIQGNRPDEDLIIQTNYPSINNLLTSYLPRGGWLTYDEASTIEVIGYPSQDGALDLDSVLGFKYT